MLSALLLYMYVCCLIAKLYLTLCDAVDCSTPGFPVVHHLPEFVQIHVHRVGDVIQPPQPLLYSFSFFCCSYIGRHDYCLPAR